MTGDGRGRGAPAHGIEPFRAGESGLDERSLLKYRKVLRGIYVDLGTPPTAAIRARAAWLYGGGGAVLGGRSAAAVLGVRFLDTQMPHPDALAEESHGYLEQDWTRNSYIDPEPAVLIRPRSGGAGTCRGLTVHRADLPAGEILRTRGMRVTSPVRTGFDLARWPASRVQGWDPGSRADFDRRVVLLDCLCRGAGIDPADILLLAGRHPRAAGQGRVRAVLPWVDSGADSPPETHLRLLLIRSGLPYPETQCPVFDGHGVLRGHVDLGWPQWKVGLDYDGSWHERSDRQRSKDTVRRAKFGEHGWRMLRVDKDLLYVKPTMLLDLAAAQLRAAGCPVSV